MRMASRLGTAAGGRVGRWARRQVGAPTRWRTDTVVRRGRSCTCTQISRQAQTVCKTWGMSIRILAVGKRHEDWVADGIDRYERRLKKPFDVRWQLVPHSAREGNVARDDESARMLDKITPDEFVVVLDERGSILDSPGVAKVLETPFAHGKQVTCIIGGAYGVNDALRQRANSVWSLSKLVFPHQLVRLILAEQLYRAQEIAGGRPYHHV